MSKRRQPPGGKREKVRDIFVPRPFEGLPSEVEWVALRELVPAASAPLTLSAEYAERYPDRTVVLATILPMAWPVLTKPDGRVLVGLQRHQQSGDVSRDLAVAILNGLDAPPGGPVAVPPLPGAGPRLQDILADVPLQITMHDGFDFWLDSDAGDDAEVAASLEQANASILPTAKLAAAAGAYWTRVPDRAHVRWVLPDAEDAALDALSRLAADGDLLLGEGTKFAGMFRAHGLLVPVWDVPRAPQAAEWEQPLADFAKRYAEALAVSAPLTPEQRRARNGLLGRQLTIR